MSASIGVATMLPDGALELDLRTQSGGRHGATRISYPKEHPHYVEVLRHLGGLKVGESKPVPPWDDAPR